MDVTEIDLEFEGDPETAWLEDVILGGFRVWQIMFFCFGALLSVVIILCCCFRFRVPRTKQEIEADYQRKKIAKKFRERLAYIKNSEMDEMDLQKALARVQEEFEAETKKVDDQRYLNSNMQTITNRTNSQRGVNV